MCRMLLIKGDYKNRLPGIFRSFQLASQKDPFPDPDYNHEHHTHGDGWGFANFTGKMINHAKFLDPVYQSAMPELENGILMMHSRKTSFDQPHGAINNHPFVSSTEDAQIYLSHNGWVNKYTLYPNEAEEKLEKITDSEAFLRYITEKNPVKLEDFESVFDALEREKVEYALLNIFITVVSRADGSFSSFYFTDKGRSGKGYEDFDRLYFVSGDNWKGVFSSSLLEFDQFPEYNSRTEVPRGKLFRLQ